MRFTWERAATRSQGFALVTDAGPVQVRAEQPVFDAPARVTSPEGVVTVGTRRLVGFAPGDGVVVVGVVGPTGVDVDAAVVAGGSAKTWRAEQQTRAKVPLAMGGGLVVAGVGALVAAVRARKERAR